MSVLVMGMEMPTSCDECYIREKDTCPLTKTNVTGWGRPLNCPLIELPPHGRLIDADALHYSRIRIAHPNGDIGGLNAVVMSAEIKDAPTIIEADHEEEKMK